VGSLGIGSLHAFKELELKNFIAYTSINQMGFLLLGFCCGTSLSVFSSLYYFFIYITSLIGFLLMTLFSNKFFSTKTCVTFYDFKFTNEILRNGGESVFLIVMSTFLLSFAGLPPFSGFFGKLTLYLSLFSVKYYFLIFVIFFFNLLNYYYYLKVLTIV